MVWGVGVLAYAIAVMHRASLGVAGLEAAEHFGTTGGVISIFVVLQLGVYAVAQVPVGVVLDRLGSRLTIASGTLIAGASQAMLAIVDDLPAAYAARILLGLGDACIFNSVLRLLPRWFKPGQVPLLSQITGMAGALGQVNAVWLVLPAIQTLGWRAGLLVVALVSAVVAVVGIVVVRDAPPGAPREVAADHLRELPGKVTTVLRHPATQLGFWVHFTSGFSVNAFVFMWGMPYLLVGQGLSQAVASGLFVMLSAASVVAGPIVGLLTARHPLRRSNLALIVITAVMGSWAVVLLWPGTAPLPLLVMLVLALSAGGPGTAIGFDYPRTLLPATRLGTATGIVITGAFTGGTAMILVMGLFLDWVSGGQPYTAEHLRWAFALQMPFFVSGLIGIFVSRTRLRRMMRSYGVVVPTWREVAARYRRERRRGE